MIAGVAGVESSFLVQSVPCVREYAHHDVPAIMVFCEYLCALEVCLCVCVGGGERHSFLPSSPSGSHVEADTWHGTLVSLQVLTAHRHR